ncbi:MAG: zinc metalloprotease HtpX [Chloroflexota bacterium]
MIENRTHNHRIRNVLHSILLIVAMLALLALLGYSLFGTTGLVWMMIIGLILLFVGQRISPQLVMRLYNARPLSKREAPQLYRLTEILSQRAELKTVPQLYYVPSQMLNAFAVGVDKNAAIGLTDGLLRNLNLQEVVGVLAHELSHVDHNDMWVMGFADIISRVTHLFSSVGKFLLIINLPLLFMGYSVIPWFGILMLIITPILVDLLQLALSRTREFDADVGAVELTGDPEGLASALSKLEHTQTNLLRQVLVPGHREPNPSIFRTHPNTDDRIERLYALAGKEAPAIVMEEEPVWQFAPADLARVAQRPRWRYTSGLWY